MMVMYKESKENGTPTRMLSCITLFTKIMYIFCVYAVKEKTVH